MILDVLRLEEEVKTLKGDPATKKGSSLKDVGGAGEVGALKKELEAKDRDMANLKKQVDAAGAGFPKSRRGFNYDYTFKFEASRALCRWTPAVHTIISSLFLGCKRD